MAVDVLLGLQWGDEGKGKIVDYLAPQYDLICRFQGGPNAGHSLHFDGKQFVLHTIPSGIFREGITNLIGNGVVIDPITLVEEMSQIEGENIDVNERLLLSKRAHFILPTHRWLDKASEHAKGKDKIGSTLKGIGPTYMDKTGRNGLRIGDLTAGNIRSRYKALKEKHMGLLRIYPDVEFDLEAEEQKWFDAMDRIADLSIVDGERYLYDACAHEKKILAEGAQGSMLDINYGTYPFVTSSITLSSGVCNGLGISPKLVGKVIGITKAYCTRVGSGPFPTELFDGEGSELQRIGHEFGATTGRPRRCGWLDMVQLRYSVMLNGVDELVITKLDVLSEFDHIQLANEYRIGDAKCKDLPYNLEDDDLSPVFTEYKGWKQDITRIRSFDKLPHEARAFLQQIEHHSGVECRYVSVGPDREELIIK